MLVHEERGAGQGPGTIELPELSQRLRPRRCVLLLCLCIRPDRATVGIDDAHRIGKDVEHRLELRDAARQVFTQLLALGDVAARKQDAPSPVGVDERDERGLDQPAATAMLERHTHGDDRHAARGDVHLLGQVGECVRKRIVDGASAGLRDVESREVAIARVRRDERECAVEQRNRERHSLEEGIEARKLVALYAGGTVENGRQHGIKVQRNVTLGQSAVSGAMRVRFALPRFLTGARRRLNAQRLSQFHVKPNDVGRVASRCWSSSAGRTTTVGRLTNSAFASDALRA